MDFDAYRALPGINWSTLTEMRRSPLHYRHRRENQREDTPRLGLGRAIHARVLEPDRFQEQVAVFTGATRRGKSWDEFEAANIGRTILKPDELERVEAVAAAVYRHPVAARYLSEGKAEHTLTWTDPETGLICKARADWISDSALVDLKTARDVSMRGFGSSAAKYGYAGQLAFYLRGVKAVTGKELPAVLVAVEVDAPYDVAVLKLGEDELYAADREVSELLARVKECEETGQWPGQHPEESFLVMPRWWYGDEDEMSEDAAAGAEWLMSGDG